MIMYSAYHMSFSLVFEDLGTPPLGKELALKATYEWRLKVLASDRGGRGGRFG